METVTNIKKNIKGHDDSDLDCVSCAHSMM